MFNFLRNKQKDVPATFRTLVFKEDGLQPLNNIDFIKQNVFQINDFVLRSPDEITNLYEEFVNTYSYFEIWIIPTIINPNLAISSMLDKFKNKDVVELKAYLDYITEVVRDRDIKVDNSYLVVNKENSELVTKKFEKLSFSLKRISSDEAKDITVIKVKYPTLTKHLEEDNL